jgi:hypothetical protein
VGEDGAFRARKQCGSKLLLIAPKSRACIMSYSTKTRGCPPIIQPCFDPEGDLVSEQGLVAEILA